MNRDQGIADLSALEKEPPPQVFRGRLEFHRRTSVILLGLLSVALLSLSFEPVGQWYLAYFALVPWALATGGSTRRGWALLCAYVCGLVFWAANLHWLWWITLPGYFSLVIYISVYWLIAGLVVRSAMRRHWPMWLVLPIIWVAAEYARAYVISGLPWFFLAHTQYAQTRLIQISDLTGQYGVSFFVAMANGALVDVLASPLFVRRREGAVLARRNIVGLVATVATCCGLLAYGHWRLGQDTQEPGPVIGVVQEAYPIWLGEPPAAPDETTRKKWRSRSEDVFQRHCGITEYAFAGAGCDLVVWPETVLPQSLNRELLNEDHTALSPADALALAKQLEPALSDEDFKTVSAKIFLHILLNGGRLRRDAPRQIGLREQADQIAQLSRKLGCAILAGGSSIHYNANHVDDDDRWVTRNSSLWFDGAARTSREYAKMHLVPFGEYVPFKHSWPWLHKTLRRFVPSVMAQLDPGKVYEPFELKRRGKTWRLASPICYEGTFSRVCRRMVVQNGRKNTDILVNMSNDGWFVWKWGPWAGQSSAEHSQHLVQYCFRAVENRVPVIRAVNTGISASIDSNGRIVAEVRRGKVRTGMVVGTLQLGRPARAPEKASSRPTSGAVELLSPEFPQVLVDSRVSWYSIVGDVFAQAISLSAIAIILWMAFRRPSTDERARQ